jgi:hypothetical protein
VLNSSLKFTGKLKVNWLEKYKALDCCGRWEPLMKENIVPPCKTLDGCDTSDQPKNNDIAVGPILRARLKNGAEGTNSSNGVAAESETSPTDTQDRKLSERAGRGLIYKKFMASSYSSNRKEKSR